MRRFSLIGAAAAVLIAVVLLIWRAGDSADEKTTGEPPAKVQREPRKTPARAPLARSARPSAKPTPRAQPVAVENANTREYVTDTGRVVRDHRSGDRPDYAADNPKPKKPQKLEPRVVADVREGVYDAVRECSQSLDRSAFGEKPRATAEVVLSIDEQGQVTTDKSRIQLGDVEQEQGTALAGCIHEQTKSLGFSAQGHEKISQYRVTLVFPLK